MRLPFGLNCEALDAWKRAAPARGNHQSAWTTRPRMLRPLLGSLGPCRRGALPARSSRLGTERTTDTTCLGVPGEQGPRWAAARRRGRVEVPCALREPRGGVLWSWRSLLYLVSVCWCSYYLRAGVDDEWDDVVSAKQKEDIRKLAVRCPSNLAPSASPPRESACAAASESKTSSPFAAKQRHQRQLSQAARAHDGCARFIDRVAAPGHGFQRRGPTSCRRAGCAEDADDPIEPSGDRGLYAGAGPRAKELDDATRARRRRRCARRAVWPPKDVRTRRPARPLASGSADDPGRGSRRRRGPPTFARIGTTVASRARAPDCAPTKPRGACRRPPPRPSARRCRKRRCSTTRTAPRASSSRTRSRARARRLRRATSSRSTTRAGPSGRAGCVRGPVVALARKDRRRA